MASDSFAEYFSEYMRQKKLQENNLVAPSQFQQKEQLTSGDIAPVVDNNRDTWFQKGVFKDGYQKWDAQIHIDEKNGQVAIHFPVQRKWYQQ